MVVQFSHKDMSVLSKSDLESLLSIKTKIKFKIAKTIM